MACNLVQRRQQQRSSTEQYERLYRSTRVELLRSVSLPCVREALPRHGRRNERARRRSDHSHESSSESSCLHDAGLAEG